MVQSRTQGQWVRDCTYYMKLSSSAGSNIVSSEKKSHKGRNRREINMAAGFPSSSSANSNSSLPNSLLATTSPKRPPPVSDHFANNRFVSQSNTASKSFS